MRNKIMHGRLAGRLRSAAVAATVTVLAGCAGNIKPGPSINSIAGQGEPDSDKLIVQESAPVERNQAMAIENYRKLLELEASPEKRFEAMRRLADLQVELGEVNPEYRQKQALYANDAPLDSLELYEGLLAQRPGDANNDRVLYQMARALQNRGREAEAVDALARLRQQFPDSRYSRDGTYRRAELLFRLRRYDEAEADYAAVIAQGESDRHFDQAQYKQGWSIFKQSRYGDAVAAFLPLLKRKLPDGEVPTERAAALAEVPEKDRELVSDVLRVTALSFAYSDGGRTLTDVLNREGGTRFDELLFADLGETLLDKERFTDASTAFRSYVSYKPDTLDAPRFQLRSIGALESGGFEDLAVGAREEYVALYDPSASWWTGRGSVGAPEGVAPPPAPQANFVQEAWQKNLEDVARHYHAVAQAETTLADARARGYARAGRYYRRYTQAFPKAEKTPEINVLLAETLYDTGQYSAAAEEFTRAAYDYGSHDRAADAGFAAVQSYQLAADASATPGAQNQGTLATVDAAVRYADTFPEHPEVAPALTKAAEDLYAIGEQTRAALLATRVVQREPAPAPELRRSAFQVIGLSSFDQTDYATAETAFTQVLNLTPVEAGQARSDAVEQLASSIYKQAEQAREAGDLDAAVDNFLRVGQVTPGASIRETADFDAAAALIAQQNWDRAATVLTDFRTRYPSSPRQGDVTRRLASVYLESDQPIKAAGEFQRIARSPAEPQADRQAAALKSAELYYDNNALAQAGAAYGSYLAGFNVDFDQATEIRQRLIDIYTDIGRPAEANLWRRELVESTTGAGGSASDRARLLAARAGLVLAEEAKRNFDGIRLTLPLSSSLPAKRRALEAALSAYNRAAQAGVAEVTTEATHQTGMLYAGLARDLLDSERPGNLDEFELDQYELLLEEQAYPFEEKAIDIFEANAARADQGVYDEWVRASIDELAKLLPARFGKRERYEKPVNAIR